MFTLAYLLFKHTYIRNGTISHPVDDTWVKVNVLNA